MLLLYGRYLPGSAIMSNLLVLAGINRASLQNPGLGLQAGTASQLPINQLQAMNVLQAARRPPAPPTQAPLLGMPVLQRRSMPLNLHQGKSEVRLSQQITLLLFFLSYLQFKSNLLC